MTIEILPISPPMVEWWWGFAEPFVKAALEHGFGESTSDDIKEACKERHMQLWVISRNRLTIGAATTMVVPYARKRVVRIVTFGGKDFESWAEQAIEFIKDWAREAEADAIEVFVRKGFEKKLASHGLNPTYVVMVGEV